jgi:hypothetical protein
MKDVVGGFPWLTFFSRIIGGYIIVVLWIVKDARLHRVEGVVAAFVTGAVLTLICYLWSRPNSHY